jgi:hypothetical protein
MIPKWFLYIAGFSLIILGGLQIQARPRKPGDSFYTRFVNVGTLWSLCCIAVGGAVVLMALGWLNPDFTAPPRHPPGLRRPR